MESQAKGPSGPFCFAINIIMKSLKHYIKLVEAAEHSPAHWTGIIQLYYEFPDSPMIPQRAEQIESVVKKIMTKYGFYENGGGGGVGARDVTYAMDEPNLATIVSAGKLAMAEVQKLADEIESSSATLGIEGMYLDVGGFIIDSDSEYNLSFDEAEEMVRQSQWTGKK